MVDEPRDDETEKHVLENDALLSALWNGARIIELLYWLGTYETEYKTTLIDRLKKTEPAVRRFVEQREQGLAEGGHFATITPDELERLRRLTTLAIQWQEGGAFSPEIIGLAGELLRAMRRPYKGCGGDA